MVFGGLNEKRCTREMSPVPDTKELIYLLHLNFALGQPWGLASNVKTSRSRNTGQR